MSDDKNAALSPGGAAGSSELHKLFPSVPPTENVIHEFQCSLSRRKFLRVGRLYLTPVRLCFYSMLVDPVMLLWSDVDTCEKKSQMLFDQIIITPVDKTQYGGELCFTGFMNGASSPFSTIKTLWGVRKKYAPKSAVAGANGDSARTVPAPDSGAQAADHDSSKAAATVVEPVAPPVAAESQPPGPAVVTTTAQTPPSPSRAVPPGNSPVEAKVTPASSPPSPSPATLQVKQGTPPLNLENKSPALVPTTGLAPEVSPLVRPSTAVESSPPLDSDSASPVENVSIVGAALPLAARRGSSSTIQLDSLSPAEPPPVAPSSTPPRSTSPAATVDHSSPVVPQTARPASGTSQAPKLAEIPPLAPTESPSKSSVAPTPKSATVVAQEPTGEPHAAPMAGTHRRTRSEEASMHAASQSDTLRSFPSVPRTESILDTFQCSYVSGVHRIGKMHITSNYVLFHSVMLTEPVVAKIIEIGSVEKITSLLLFEGLTLVMRDGTRYEFTSFISRDKALQMITQLIATHEKVARSIGMNVTAGARPASPAARAEELPARSATPTSRGILGLGSPNLAPEPSTTTTSTKLPTPELAPVDKVTAATAAPPVPASALEASLAAANSNFLRTKTADVNGPLPGLANIEEFDALVPTDYGNGLSKPGLFLETPVSDEFKYPPGYNLFDVFYGLFDDSGPVLRQYREMRRETELSWEPWRGPAGGPAAAAKIPMCGQRSFKCNTMIRALLVEKLYPFEEYQRYGFCNIAGVPTLIYQTSGQASGVTFSDTFRAETLYVYTESTDPATALPQVTSRMYLYIQFIKFSIVKAKIRSATTAELKEGMAKLNDMTRDYLKASPSRARLRAVAATSKSQTAPSVAAVVAAPAAVIEASTPVLSHSVAHPHRHTHDAVSSRPSSGAPPVVFSPRAMLLSLIEVPEEIHVSVPIRVLHLLAAQYLLRALWHMFFFGGGIVEGSATLDADTAALHSSIATVALVEFFTYIVRPFVLGVVCFAFAACLSLGWGTK